MTAVELTGEGRGRQGLLQAMANHTDAVTNDRQTTSARRRQGDLQQTAGEVHHAVKQQLRTCGDSGQADQLRQAAPGRPAWRGARRCMYVVRARS